MTALRVAVVGVGSLGQHHARIAAGSEQAELVAVVDPSEERGREIAGKFNTRWVAGLDQVLEQVDAVQVAAPTGFHHEIGLQVLAAGKHIIMEKPLAATQEQGAALLAALNKARAGRPGLVASVGHLERFNPAVTALRKLGIRPHFAEAIRVSPFPMRSMEVDVIMDVMIHDLDLLLALIGREVVSVEAVGVPILTKYADLVNARLKFEGGAFATVTASRVARKKERVLRAFGANSYASLDFAGQKLEVLRLGAGANGPEVRQEVVDIVEGEPLKLELEAFYQACLGLGDQIVSWQDAYNAMAVARMVQVSVAESLANLEIRA
jgi:predicted dehydrogenase